MVTTVDSVIQSFGCISTSIAMVFQTTAAATQLVDCVSVLAILIRLIVIKQTWKQIEISVWRITFKQCDRIRTDNNFLTAQDSLPYLSKYPAIWLTNLLGPNQVNATIPLCSNQPWHSSSYVAWFLIQAIRDRCSLAKVRHVVLMSHKQNEIVIYHLIECRCNIYSIKISIPLHFPTAHSKLLTLTMRSLTT